MNNLVMLIDDSPTVRKVIEVCLKREGIACMSYADGIEALHALSSQRDLIPNVVLLDIELPKMDGYQVAQYLRERNRYDDTAIVMISCHYSMIDRLKSRLSGAQDYMTKPLKAQDMLSVVRGYLSA